MFKIVAVPHYFRLKPIADNNTLPLGDVGHFREMTQLVGQTLRFHVPERTCFGRDRRYVVLAVHPSSSATCSLLFVTPSKRTWGERQILLMALTQPGGYSSCDDLPNRIAAIVESDRGTISHGDSRWDGGIFRETSHFRKDSFVPLQFPPVIYVALNHGDPRVLNFSSVVGSGGFSQVARYGDFVVKIPTTSHFSEAVEEPKRERKLTRNISRLELVNRPVGSCTFVTSSPPFYNISLNVYPYVAGQTLEDFLRAGYVDSPTIARHFSDLVLVLMYLHHDKGIVHLDLTLTNIKEKEGSPLCVLDLGLSKPFSTHSGSLVLHNGYLPPEIDDPSLLPNNYHIAAIDYWHVGVVIFSELVGKNPFMEKKEAISEWIRCIDPQNGPALIERHLCDMDAFRGRKLLGAFLIQGDADQRRDRLCNLVRLSSPYGSRYSGGALWTLCTYLGLFLSPYEERLSLGNQIVHDSGFVSTFSSAMGQVTSSVCFTDV